MTENDSLRDSEGCSSSGFEREGDTLNFGRGQIFCTILVTLNFIF